MSVGFLQVNAWTSQESCNWRYDSSKLIKSESPFPPAHQMSFTVNEIIFHYYVMCEYKVIKMGRTGNQAFVITMSTYSYVWFACTDVTRETWMPKPNEAKTVSILTSKHSQPNIWKWLMAAKLDHTAEGCKAEAKKKHLWSIGYGSWTSFCIFFPFCNSPQLLCIQSQYTSEASSDDKHGGYYMNARLMAQHLNHNIVNLILAIHVHYQPIDGLLYTLLFSWAWLLLV